MFGPALAAIACSGEPLPPPNPAGTTSAKAVSAAEGPAPAPPAFRLPKAVAPRKMAVTLAVSPREETFRGEVTIDIALAGPARVLWLHATELSVTQAHLVVAGQRWAVKVVPGGADFVGFALEREAPAGEVRLVVSYTGRVQPEEDRGVFREKEGADVYLYSQFESTYARRAFPCFDEPSFKVPWQVTLRVPASEVALSNTPALDEAVDADGWKTVRFAETKPLPSYLVAFAVGPFELVDAGRAGKNGAPIRFAVPRGRAAETGFATGASRRVIDLLEGEFGIPYPYEKLDFVIIPHLASFGAMENAGLITVGARYVLVKPGEETLGRRHTAVTYLGHEVAHQWFGDLVTPAWWDDLWLNEGFATWMEERKVAPRFDPAFGAELDAISSAAWVMGEDGLLSARKVRQEVASQGDILNAFDGITYQKGGAVIAMFEAWMGADAFRKGVKLYLERFAHKTATSDDFLTALGEGAGRDVKAAMSTFLDQPGVPIVTHSLACDAAGARLSLAQERYLPIGSQGSAAGATWQIPVCARYGAGKESGRACGLLGGAKGELVLPALPGQKKGGCPDWVMPNADGVGYYRSAYSVRDVDALLGKGAKRLGAAERMSVVHNLHTLVSNARFPIGEALSRLPGLLKDPSEEVQSAAAGLLGLLHDDLVEVDLRPSARRFVTKLVAPRLKALGWQARAGDSSEVRSLRGRLIHYLVELGDDPKLLAEAEVLADGWLKGTGKIEPDFVGVVLKAATSWGDRGLFDRMVAALRAEKDSQRRERLIAGLSGFRDPAIARAALELFLEEGMDPREGIKLFWHQPRSNRVVVWAFVKERFDALLARLPEGAQGFMLSVPEGFCDEASRADAALLLKERAPKVPGGPRLLEQALESISLCIARREAYKDSLRAFLKR